MSIKIMSRIWESGPPDPMQRLVLLAIADHADDAGRAYPSMIGIASKCGMSERGARGIIRKLEAGGWLETRVGGGRGGKSHYTVNPEPETRNDKPGMTNPECERQETRNDTTLNPEPRSAEPSRTIREPSKSVRPRANFDAFWAAYPRKVGKGAARKAYDKAVKRADPDEISAGLSRQLPTLSQKQTQYIPHASTWLNEERWTDEPEQLGDGFRRGQVVSGPFSSGRGRGGGIAAAVARRQLGGTS